MNRAARLALAAPLALALCSAWAQADPAREQARVQAETRAKAERERIAAERGQVEAEFGRAQAQCYQKFAVNDCVAAARTKRYEALADLRRQEVSLNDEERKQRAADRLRELDERNSAEQRQREQERRAKAQADQQAREARAADKARQAAETAAAAKERAAQGPRQKPERELPDTEENARRHEERVKEAQEHRANVEARAASKAGRQVKPLPVPP